MRTDLRPQDVEVEQSITRSPGAVGARVARIRAAGPAVRPEPTLASGGALWVELLQRRQAALNLVEGSAGGVFPRIWRTYR